jgi:hypothetical protein
MTALTKKEAQLIDLLLGDDYTKAGDTYTMIGEIKEAMPWNKYGKVCLAKLGYCKVDDTTMTVTYGGYGLVGWAMEGAIEDWCSEYGYTCKWDGDWQTKPIEPVGDWKYMDIAEVWDNLY